MFLINLFMLPTRKGSVNKTIDNGPNNKKILTLLRYNNTIIYINTKYYDQKEVII
jgi:hypothetical protein